MGDISRTGLHVSKLVLDRRILNNMVNFDFASQSREDILS